MINLMYMDDIKQCEKNEKKWRIINPNRIYSQDIGMELGIEKYTMLIMKDGKVQITE